MHSWIYTKRYIMALEVCVKLVTYGSGILLLSVRYIATDILLCEVLAHDIGKAIGQMHSLRVVHGDLTTSNLMVRSCLNPHVHTSFEETVSALLTWNEQWSTEPSAACPLVEVVLLDFGLGMMQAKEEDMAVDLYVLERAFISTHPGHEAVVDRILHHYKHYCTHGAGVLDRLEQVRKTFCFVFVRLIRG